MSNGYIEVAGQRFGISSRGPGGEALPPNQIAIFEVRPAGESLPPDTPMCGTNTAGWIRPAPPGDGFDPRTPPIRNLRQIQLAVRMTW